MTTERDRRRRSIAAPLRRAMEKPDTIAGPLIAYLTPKLRRASERTRRLVAEALSSYAEQPEENSRALARTLRELLEESVHDGTQTQVPTPSPLGREGCESAASLHGDDESMVSNRMGPPGGSPPCGSQVRSSSVDSAHESY